MMVVNMHKKELNTKLARKLLYSIFSYHIIYAVRMLSQVIYTFLTACHIMQLCSMEHVSCAT